jgi:hypothetical protein
MKASEIIITEAAMNPSAYAASMSEASKRGVLVGFEFEVYVTKEALEKLEQATSAKADDGDNKSEFSEEDWIRNFDRAERNFIGSGYLPREWLRISLEDCDKIFTFRKGIKIGVDQEPATSVSEMVANRRLEFMAQFKKRFKDLKDIEKEKILKKWDISSAKEKDSSEKGFLRWIIKDLSYDGMSKLVQGVNRRGDLMRPAFDYFEPENKLKGWALARVIIPYLITDLGTGGDPSISVNLDAAKKFSPEAALVPFEPESSRYSDYDSEYDNAAKGMAAMLKKTGKKVKIFQSYHQSKKALDTWYIEPDSSLEEEEPFDGTSMEIVSPPIPAAEAIATMKEFVAMAKSIGLYTDSNTGLHINVSIPDKLDALKLVVFSGEEHVLKKFAREESNYVEPVLQRLKRTTGEPIKGIKIDADKKGLVKWLGQIAKNATNNHTASVSDNGDYISFRHAGDDYLNNLDAATEVIGRFVRIMVIAATPTAYQDDYNKRLMAILAPTIDADRAARGLVITEPSSPALNWIKKNGWPAVTMWGTNAGDAYRMVRKHFPNLQYLDAKKTEADPAEQQEVKKIVGTLKVYKWIMPVKDLKNADMLMAKAGTKFSRFGSVVTMPVEDPDVSPLYRDALKKAKDTAQQSAKRRQ